MGGENEGPALAKAALDIRWGELRSEFNTMRNSHSREGVIEIVTVEIMQSFIELPTSVRREYLEEAIAFIMTLGNNFFRGEI